MADPATARDFSLTTHNCSIVQIEGWNGVRKQFEAEAARLLGAALPECVGKTIHVGDGLLIRIAPMRYWLLSDDSALTTNLVIDPAIGGSIMLTDGRVRFRLAGSSIADILSRCLAIDWHALSAGYAVQTGFHHVPVLLLRIDRNSCDLIVPRSFAKNLEEWIGSAI